MTGFKPQNSDVSTNVRALRGNQPSFDLSVPSDATAELRYAIERTRLALVSQNEHGHPVYEDPTLLLGPVSDAGEIDQTIYRWQEGKEGCYWQAQKDPVLRGDAVRWLTANAPDKVDGSRYKSCVSLLTLQLVNGGRFLRPDTRRSIVPLRNAYLSIEEDGRILAHKPDKRFHVDYAIQSDLDWSRVDPATGEYTPVGSVPGGFWHRYVSTAFIDQDVHDYSQEALSILLLSKCYEKGIVLYGDGENGKSVMLHILRSLAPKHTQSVNIKRLVSNEFGTASLINKRLAVIGEMPDRFTKDMQEMLKTIISWDPLPAEFKGKDAFTFIPRVVIVGATNHFPEVSNHEHGFWRKIEIIPFTKRVDKDAKIQELHQKIIGAPEEMAQVVDWLLAGASRLVRNGWRKEEDKPLAVRQLSDEHRRSTDTVMGWLHDTQLTYDERAETSKQAIYQDYCRHVDDAGKKPVSDVKFWQRLKAHFREFNFLPENAEQRSRKGKRVRVVPLRCEGIEPLSFYPARKQWPGEVLASEKTNEDFRKECEEVAIPGWDNVS